MNIDILSHSGAENCFNIKV